MSTWLGEGQFSALSYNLVEGKLGHVRPEPHTVKTSVDWISYLLGPLCLLPLLILLVFWSGAHQSSFRMFLTLELIVIVFWALAIVFSLWGFRKRSFKLKFLNLTTIVLATILGLLVGFSLL